jgi:hypothetical protein
MVAMGEPTHPSPTEDSLDIVERVMAIEEALIDPQATPGESGDYFDDDALASLVRNPKPRRPSDQAGAAAKSEAPSFE